MWVVVARLAVLSVIVGCGRWVEIKTYTDPLYQHLIVTDERELQVRLINSSICFDCTKRDRRRAKLFGLKAMTARPLFLVV